MTLCLSLLYVAAGNYDVSRYVGCCRWLNVFLFEVIDCCMSESGDVIIVELETFSLLDLSSFQWFINAATYQLTCCSLSIVVEAQDDWWPQDDVQRAQNACCVVVFTVEEESLFALLPYLLTHHVLFDDTGCQKLSNFNVCGGKVLIWWLIKVEWSGSPF